MILGCAGLTPEGGLYACEDYWQYTPIKQLREANNCLKVNNSSLLYRRDVCVSVFSMYVCVRVCFVLGGGWWGLANQIELISPTYVSFMRRHATPVTLALYSWLIHGNTRGGGFSRMHKEMNRGCRAVPICL